MVHFLVFIKSQRNDFYGDITRNMTEQPSVRLCGFYRNEDKPSDQTDFLPNTAEKVKLQRQAGEFQRLASDLMTGLNPRESGHH